MQNVKTINRLAEITGKHPIHIKMFFLQYAKKTETIDEASFERDIIVYYKESPKPFVKWVGGKRQLAKQFREMNLYPPDEFDPKTGTYFEPFVGGGAMFFDLLPQKAVLSDLNSELITTYNVIKNDVEKLIGKLKEHKKKNTKEHFLEVRAWDLKKLSDVNIAARFIFLNRTCFNGMYRVNKSGGFNVPYGANKNPLICDEDNLMKVHKKLQNIEILNEDYKKVLGKAKKGDFVYFDPPYYPVNVTSSFTSYTKEGFFEKEQIELKDAFMKLHKKGCFVKLSNSNTPFINELYSGLDKNVKINQVFAGRAINSKGNKRGKVKEVVVVNY